MSPASAGSWPRFLQPAGYAIELPSFYHAQAWPLYEERARGSSGSAGAFAVPESRESTSTHGHQDRGTQIAVMKDDGSMQKLLTSSGQNDSPRWSPDSRRIVFVSDLGSLTEIRVIDADGSRQTRLTAGRRDLDPTWSPDGRRIAFRSVEPRWAIYVMNADGTSQKQLTATGVTYGLEWSPDGQWIAFVSETGGRAQIYVAKSDGSKVGQLTSNQAACYSPTWSADSRRIAFSCSDQIFVIDADSRNQTPLTTTPVSWAPAWSPDGQRITFLASRETPWSQVWVMKADGSAQTRLTSFAGNAQVQWRPVWAPDSRRIAFNSSITIWSGTVRVRNRDQMESSNLRHQRGWQRDEANHRTMINRRI